MGEMSMISYHELRERTFEVFGTSDPPSFKAILGIRLVIWNYGQMTTERTLRELLFYSITLNILPSLNFHT